MTLTTHRCGICHGDENRRIWINTELSKKTPHSRIETLSRQRGFNVKRETIRKHVNICIAAEVERRSSAASELASARWSQKRGAGKSQGARPEVSPPTSPSEAIEGNPETEVKRREVAPMPLPDTDDMAVLVRAAAVEKLKAGELRITTQDGLAAQNLLDRREEKKKDRELITQLGVLLSRGSEAPPMLNVTEGEYQVVEEPPQLTNGQ